MTKLKNKSDRKRAFIAVLTLSLVYGANRYFTL